MRLLDIDSLLPDVDARSSSSSRILGDFDRLRLNGVGFVGCLNLADRRRPTHTCEDMLDVVFAAEVCEL